MKYRFAGTEKLMALGRYELEQYPEDKTEKDLEKHVATAIRHHMQNFLASIDAHSHPISDIELGYISTASCILANNSMRLGRSLAWDLEKQLVVGDSEANALLRHEYRKTTRRQKALLPVWRPYRTRLILVGTAAARDKGGAAAEANISELA